MTRRAETEPTFPIQATRSAGYPGRRVPWSLAEKAYRAYSALYGTGQSLERLAERGGFDNGELDVFARLADEGIPSRHRYDGSLSLRADALFAKWYDEHPRRHPADNSPLVPLWYP